MAHFPWHMVPGICLYPAGRKPCGEMATYSEHLYCLAADRDLARGKLEFCAVGAVLWCFAACREVYFRKVFGKTAGSLSAHLLYVLCHARLESVCV